MRENDEREALADLEARVAKARRQQDEKAANKKAKEPDGSLSMAYRLSMELVVAIGVGGVMGYFLDGWLDTKPWLMLTFLFMGMAGGVLNAFRASEKMTEALRKKQDEDKKTKV